jgi:hypothetical protein
MADVNFEFLMQSEVQIALRTVDPLAVCYVYSLPTDDSTAPIRGVVFPSSGFPLDAQKNVTLQVRVRGRDEAIGKTAIEAVYEALKDCEFSPGTYNTFKVICTAVSTPSFMGMDDAGQPIFVCLFELVSVY